MVCACKPDQKCILHKEFTPIGFEKEAYNGHVTRGQDEGGDNWKPMSYELFVADLRSKWRILSPRYFIGKSNFRPLKEDVDAYVEWVKENG